jgi:Tfp pilus assembly protein PilO
MNSKRSQYTLALAGIIAAGLLVLAAGLFVWSQQQVAVGVTRAQKVTLHDELEGMTKKLNQRKDLEATRDKLAQQLLALDHDLADYRYMPTYLVELQRKAVATGNELVSITPSDIKPFDPAKSPFATAPPADPPKGEGGDNGAGDKGASADGEKGEGGGKKGKKEAPPTDLYQRINLDISGTYASVMRFLEELRGFHKLVYVRTVELSPIREKGTLKGITARVETYAIITPEQWVKLPVAADAAPTDAGAPAPVAEGGKR